MAGTVTVDTIQSSVSSPTVFKNTSGTEIGQLCRTWLNLNGSTTTVTGGFGISSVTKSVAGNYTVYFSNAFIDANYCLVGCHQDIGSSRSDVSLASGATPATGSVNIFSGLSSGAYGDTSYVYVAFFR